MNGILGNMSMPPSILGGNYTVSRTVRVPQQAQPMQASPFMMMMGGPAPGPSGGEDPRDAPGSGVSIWRELMRGLSEYGIGALSPDLASQIFSPENRALLGEAYQKQSKGK